MDLFEFQKVMMIPITAVVILLILGDFALKEKSFEIKTSYIILIFYSSSSLFSSDYINHTYGIYYNFNIEVILVYSYLFLIIISFYEFSKKIDWTGTKLNAFKNRMVIGEKLMTLVAVFGVFINTILNFHHFDLIKTDYILAERIPNLIIIHLPIESILLAALLKGIFNNKMLKLIIFILYLYSIALDFFLGYRMNLFFLCLFISFYFFKKGYIFTASLFIALSGDFINSIKSLIQNRFSGNLDLISNFSVNEFKFLTSEQLNIFSNTFIGIKSKETFNSLYELVYLLPGYGKLFPLPYPLSADKLALLKDVDPSTGAGVGYSFQLFIYENLLVGSLMIGLVVLLIQFSNKTIISIMSLELFFSMMRNSTSYWSGILMKIILVLIFCFIMSLLYQRNKDFTIFKKLEKL